MALIFDPVTGLPSTKQRKPADTFNPAPQVPVSSFIDLSGTKPSPLNLSYAEVPSGATPATYPGYFGAGALASLPSAPVNTSYTPDLQSQIETDPLYVQQKADLAAQRVSDLSSRTAARQRALTLFGEIPDFTGVAGLGDSFEGDITDTIRGLAAENTKAGLSTVARLNQAHQDALSGIKNALAARGILSSGELPFQYNREDQSYRTAQFDARQKLLDYLSGVQSAYLESERARQAALINAAYAAAGRIPPPSSGGGTGEPTSGPPPEPPIGFPGDFKPAATRAAGGLTKQVTPYVQPATTVVRAPSPEQQFINQRRKAFA